MLDFAGIVTSTRVRLCLDCGKCTVVCPVARYDPEFNPRLIVQRTLKQGAGGPMNEKIWSCINCNMCMERCNYNVKFTDFIIALREKALASGYAVDYTHGGTPQAMMHIMARRDLRQNRLDWLPKNIEVQEGGDTAFFVGCAPYFDNLFKDLGVKTVEGTVGALKLLNLARIPFTVVPSERCCGRDLLLMGDTAGFLALARANQDDFRQRGIRRIITSCPECYHTLNSEYARFIDGWNIHVQHVSEALSPSIKAGQLKLGKLDSKITYHDPCTLGRFSRIFDPPREILASINGLQMVEMTNNREKALCCGSSAWVHCGSVNKQIQKEHLAQAEATGASALVTACPKCLIHLKCAQKNLEDGSVSRIDIQDIYSLAAKSLSPEVS